MISSTWIGVEKPAISVAPPIAPNLHSYIIISDSGIKTI